MLTRVTLENFQAHEHLDLELGALTTLTGGSNSGKTAVLRAIAGLLRNDSVNGLVTYGKTGTKVTLHFQDGHVVTWEKGKSANGYTIQLPDGSKQQYTKVGAEVPEEVLDILRIAPIVMEDGKKNHLNLHEQHDSLFLVKDTPGQAAKVFGELTSAGKIFSAVNEGNRQVREDKKLKKLRTEDAEQLQRDLDRYEGLDERLATLNKGLEKLAHADKHTEAIATLRRYVEELESTQVSLDKLVKAQAKLESANVDLTPLIEVAQQWGAAIQAKTELASLERFEVESNSKLSTLSGASEVDLSRLEKVTATLAKAVEVRKELAATSTDSARQSEETLKSDLAFVEAGIRAAQEQLVECSLCGQDLTPEAKDRLLGASHVH